MLLYKHVPAKIMTEGSLRFVLEEQPLCLTSDCHCVADPRKPWLDGRSVPKALDLIDLEVTAILPRD